MSEEYAEKAKKIHHYYEKLHKRVKELDELSTHKKDEL